MNNLNKFMKNSFISIIAQITTLVLQFVNRRVFIKFLDIEYLGYQSLFSNVFSLLSVAELGIGSIISFHLYRELALDNRDEIGKLMLLYKWMYRIVACIVLIAGIICYFFLPYIVKDATASWSFLHLIYILQLSSVVFGYFLSYKRTIYIASQQEYRCVKIDLYVSAVIQVIQLSALVLLRNYLVYLCINLSTTIISNIIISKKVDQDFPYIKEKYYISAKEIRERNIFVDMKNFLIHKIAYALYGGTDSIIISSICGIRYVALYGNYFTVQKGVMQILLHKLLDPLQATIGNIVYGNRSKDELWDQFETLDVFSFFLADYIGIGFLVFFQPFIQLWLGEEYLLSFSFVIVYSITLYFEAVFEIVYKYRSVFGQYSYDRNCMVYSAIINIAVSIPAAKVAGVTGVQLGTLIGFFPIAFGRIRFVIGKIFEKSVYKYITKHIVLFVIFLLEACICASISNTFCVNAFGMFLRGIVVILFPTIINCAIFMRNSYFHNMMNYIKEMIKNILKKIKL